jgi:hypothetical protein
VFGSERLGGEQRRQDRHQRHSAADAEQAGEEADEGSGGGVGGNPGQTGSFGGRAAAGNARVEASVGRQRSAPPDAQASASR